MQKAQIKDYFINNYNIVITDYFIDKIFSLNIKEEEIKNFLDNYIKYDYKYILNDYEFDDKYGIVTFKGSILEKTYSGGYDESSKLELSMEGGTGAVESLFVAIKEKLELKIEIKHYTQSAIGDVSSKSKVISYLEIVDEEGIHSVGIGLSSNALRSAVFAAISSVNRYLEKRSLT